MHPRLDGPKTPKPRLNDYNISFVIAIHEDVHILVLEILEIVGGLVFEGYVVHWVYSDVVVDFVHHVFLDSLLAIFHNIDLAISCIVHQVLILDCSVVRLVYPRSLVTRVNCRLLLLGLP